MSANPDDELASATAAMQELGSLDRRLNAAKRRSEESAEKAAAARDRVAVEARDVERLESMSFTKILSHLKGSHDDDVARETAEHEAAQYEYLTLEARADADRRHVDDLQRQCVDLGDVTGRYEQALTAKERWLEERNDPASVRLFEIAEERGRLTAELTEIGQAQDAGDRALGHLRGAAQLLDSARSWSAFDTWLDGGVATSMMKHERLDVVAAHIRAANAALSRFTLNFLMYTRRVCEWSSSAPSPGFSMSGSTICSPIWPCGTGSSTLRRRWSRHSSGCATSRRDWRRVRSGALMS
jgi:hypothetical protein